jgi:hypothetical protein
MRYRYRFFERLERIPMQITLMDVVKHPLLARESAGNAVGVSAPVVLRLPPVTWPRAATIHSYIGVFLLPHLEGLVNCGKAMTFLFSPPGPASREEHAA